MATPATQEIFSSNLTILHKIGAGCCGTIWANSRIIFAYKLHSGSPIRSLSNDYSFHQKILSCIEGLKITDSPPTIQVPRCYWLAQPSDPPSSLNPTKTWYDIWWDMTLSTFPPSAGMSRTSVLCTERIRPLPLSARETLISLYCPESLQEEIRHSEPNSDCLARVYLGKRRDVNPPPKRFFSLRNFPLYLDQMEALDLPTREYTKIMAETLALLHWGVKCDANDVEFVLGSASVFDTPSLDDDREGGLNNSNVRLWLLDFDQCKPIAMDIAGAEQAVNAYFRNDPYFPRPADEGPEGELWELFVKSYLHFTGDHWLECCEFAEEFLAGVEGRCAKPRDPSHRCKHVPDGCLM